MRRLFVLGLVAAVVAVTAQPAVAGGWWTTPRLEYQTPALGIGEEATVSAGVMFASTAEADEARASGEYYAYLVRGIDEQALQDAMSTGEPGDWWSRPDEVIRLERLRFGGQDSNLMDVHTSFVVPDVELGAYDLMLCNLGCTEALADVVPLRGVYVGDPVLVGLLRDSQAATDQLHAMIGRLDSGLDRAVMTLESVEATVDDIDRQATPMVMSIDSLRAAVDVLERRVASARAQPPQSQPWWGSAGWFLVGVALAALWVSRRRDDGEADDLDPGGHDTNDPDRREESELPEPEFITLG